MAGVARPTGPGSCRLPPGRPRRCSTATTTTSRRRRTSTGMTVSGARPVQVPVPVPGLSASGASTGPGLVREQRVVEMNALALEAGPGEHPDSLAYHLRRARDIRLAVGMRHIPGRDPADVTLHPIEGRVVRGHRDQLEPGVGILQPP